jgi:hypothetical protein
MQLVAMKGIEERDMAHCNKAEVGRTGKGDANNPQLRSEKEWRGPAYLASSR